MDYKLCKHLTGRHRCKNLQVLDLMGISDTSMECPIYNVIQAYFLCKYYEEKKIEFEVYTCEPVYNGTSNETVIKRGFEHESDAVRWIHNNIFVREVEK